MRSDDATLGPRDLQRVREQAHLLLRRAGALNRFPTPVGDLVRAAHLSVADDVSLDVGFLTRLYRKATSGVKHAISKVLGLLDVRDRAIYLDQTLYPAKQIFITLHETGHGVMPWQRDLFVLMEDCASTLDPDIKDQFEREANVFASEVLFQGDMFRQEAADCTFGLRTPLALAKRYGSSVYAAVRRYVDTSDRPCVVLVLDLPQPRADGSYLLELRRVISSKKFIEESGRLEWPTTFSPRDPIGAMLPFGARRRFSKPRICELKDSSGQQYTFLAEAFNSQHQVFVLLLTIAVPRRSWLEVS